MKKNKNKLTFSRFLRVFSIVIGLVLIWRGIWYILDGLDIVIFGNNHIISAVIGMIIGFVILYLPDKDLKEIEKLQAKNIKK